MELSKTMSEPDWTCGSVSLGGHLADFPQPLVYKWPNKHGIKRRLTITLTTWVGDGMGATHYYVRIEEEDNRAWNGKMWARAWDHEEERGLDFSATFDFPYQCRDYAQRIVARHFSNGEHDIEWRGLEGYHLYKKEGD